MSPWGRRARIALAVVVVLVGIAVLMARMERYGPLSSGDWVSGLPGEAMPKAHTADALLRAFRAAGYTLDKVKASGDVPPVMVRSLPPDMAAMKVVSQKKSLFFRIMLPLILAANEAILDDRARLLQLRAAMDEEGTVPSADDTAWLDRLAARYKVPPGDWERLLTRVDAIAVPLALAQAAEESGWGTSRFSREGNALFGQWTWDGSGLAPESREAGKTHTIKTFDHLLGSVKGYMHNLNTHSAYAPLRRERARLRAAGQPVPGRALASTLTKYSERGMDYVHSLQAIIRVNGLEAFRDVRLREPGLLG